MKMIVPMAEKVADLLANFKTGIGMCLLKWVVFPMFKVLQMM